MTDPKTEWKRIEVNWYGGKKKEIEIATGKSLWHRVGLDPVPIRWVLVRSIDGTFDSLPLFSSNQNNTALQIVQLFVLRWNIEVTFQELRTHLLKHNVIGQIKLSNVLFLVYSAYSVSWF